MEVHTRSYYMNTKYINPLREDVLLLLDGIPSAEYFGIEGEYNVMAMQLLGLSLEQLFVKCNKVFNLQTVLLIVDQMLLRVEYLHSKNLLHRDIKPDNFCIGSTDPHIIYLLDFGLATKYKDASTGEHVQSGNHKSLTGTARYASINAHLGNDQSRKDDLEAIGYVMIYFMKGSLPWQGLPGGNKMKKYQQIVDIKKNISSAKLCEGLPEEFKTYIEYTKKLRFDEKPDYNYLRKMLKNLFKTNNFKDYFDWEQIKDNHEVPIKCGSNTIKIDALFFAKRPSKEYFPQENGEEKKESNNDQNGKVDNYENTTKMSTHKDGIMNMPKCNIKLKEYLKELREENDNEIPDEMAQHITAPPMSSFIKESNIKI